MNLNMKGLGGVEGGGGEGDDVVQLGHVAAAVVHQLLLCGGVVSRAWFFLLGLEGYGGVG